MDEVGPLNVQRYFFSDSRYSYIWWQNAQVTEVDDFRGLNVPGEQKRCSILVKHYQLFGVRHY